VRTSCDSALFSADEIKIYCSNRASAKAFFGQKLHSAPPTFFALHLQTTGRLVKPPRCSQMSLFEKAAKDRKINVVTPARFRQEIFKRKANVPAIILRTPNLPFGFRIKIGGACLKLDYSGLNIYVLRFYSTNTNPAQ
jgi:hypothetical protein